MFLFYTPWTQSTIYIYRYIFVHIMYIYIQYTYSSRWSYVEKEKTEEIVRKWSRLLTINKTIKFTLWGE